MAVTLRKLFADRGPVWSLRSIRSLSRPSRSDDSFLSLNLRFENISSPLQLFVVTGKSATCKIFSNRNNYRCAKTSKTSSKRREWKSYSSDRAATAAELGPVTTGSREVRGEIEARRKETLPKQGHQQPSQSGGGEMEKVEADKERGITRDELIDHEKYRGATIFVEFWRN